MRDFGDHLQYSIFKCQFTRIDLARCRHLLSEIIDHRQDQMLFVDLGPVEGRGDRVITALGKATRGSRPASTPTEPAPDTRLEVMLPDYLPAWMLNEFVYCQRLFFYEWVKGIFAHDSATAEGELRHQKLETREDPLPPIGGESILHSRSVLLSSETLRPIAKMDLVESESDGVIPVDYKKGRPRDTDDGPEAWPADRVQLAAQALILRDNGYRCDEAVAYYHATRQRPPIVIDEALIDEVLSTLATAVTVARYSTIPPPLEDSPKCPRCSLVGICLPDETMLYETLARAAPDPQVDCSTR